MSFKQNIKKRIFSNMAALLFLRSSFHSPRHRENIEHNAFKQNLMNAHQQSHVLSSY